MNALCYKWSTDDKMSQWCDTAALDNCLSLFQEKTKPDVKFDSEAA